MTEDDFLKQYHDYQTHSWKEADAEAAHVNRQLEPGPNGPVVPVDFGTLGYGLMLKKAAALMGMAPQEP